MTATTTRLTVVWGKTSHPSPAGHPDRICWRDESIIEDVFGCVMVEMTAAQWVLFADQEDGGNYRDDVFNRVDREARGEDSSLNVTDWTIQKEMQTLDRIFVKFYPKDWGTGPEGGGR